MAVQITGRQIANAAVGVNKLDLSTGTFDFTSAVLQVATPSADSHAATKGYVDALAQGLHWKDSVVVATTANITLSGTQTIDGIAVVAGDRVLVKNQSTGSENGIYVVASGAWSRAADMDASSEFSGAAVFVQQGTANSDTGYVCTNDGDVTVGTTAIAFTQFTGAGQFTAGDGLDLTGSTFSVNVDDSSIEICSESLQVKAGGITNDMLAGSIANAKLANSTISGVALGANLNSLSAGNGISMTSYNGSAAVSDLTIDLDGASLALGVDGLSIADAGVTAAKIAGDAIDQSKIADAAVQREHLNSNVVNAAGAIGLDVTNNDLLVITDDSTIEIASNSLQIKDGGVTNAKLANSTISGVSLGSNLNSLSAGNGISMTSYNGSAAVSDLTIDLDGSTLAVGASGIKVATGGIDTNELAADCVTGAKISDASIATEKLNFAAFFAGFDADGSSATFEMQSALDLNFVEMFVVTVNGLVMEYKSTPDAQDNYKIDNGGTNGVARIVFGSNLANGDRVTIRGFINN